MSDETQIKGPAERANESIDKAIKIARDLETFFDRAQKSKKHIFWEAAHGIHLIDAAEINYLQIREDRGVNGEHSAEIGFKNSQYTRIYCDKSQYMRLIEMLREALI